MDSIKGLIFKIKVRFVERVLFSCFLARENRTVNVVFPLTIVASMILVGVACVHPRWINTAMVFLGCVVGLTLFYANDLVILNSLRLILERWIKRQYDLANVFTYVIQKKYSLYKEICIPLVSRVDKYPTRCEAIVNGFVYDTFTNVEEIRVLESTKEIVESDDGEPVLRLTINVKIPFF